MDRQIGEYHVIGQISRGVMGEVLEAMHVITGEKVALQTFSPMAELPETLSKQIKSRFIQEARILTRLNHPNLIPVVVPEAVAKGESDLLYYVMPYIPGNLSLILGETSGSTPITFSLTQSIRVLLPILDALEVVHERGIIHRDIKPANILFKGDHIYLSNFGIPRLWESQSQPTIQKWPATYQAPEIVLRLKDIDGRADLYSMGALMFRMLTGRIPKCPTVSPSRYHPHLNAQIDEFLLKALAPKPERRFGRVGEFRNALKKLQSSSRLISEEDGMPLASSNDPNGENDVFNQPEIRSVWRKIAHPDNESKEDEEVENMIRHNLQNAIQIFKEGDYNEAIRICKITYNIDTNDQFGYHGQIHMIVSDAVKQLKDQTHALFEQGVRYYNTGDLFKASALFRKVLQIFPQHKEAKEYYKKSMLFEDVPS